MLPISPPSISASKPFPLTGADIAIVHKLIATAEIALKKQDRLALARKIMARKLDGRRTSPKLLALIMAKPLVSAGMVAKTLKVTPQAARRIVLEAGLREMIGRGFIGRGGLCSFQ